MSAAAAAGHEQPYDEQIAAIHFLVAAAAAAQEQKKRADIYTAATAAAPASVLVEHRGLSSLFRIGIPSAGRRRALPPVPPCSLAYFGIAVICVRISYFILFTVRGLCYTLLDKTPVGKYNLFCKDNAPDRSHGRRSVP